MKKSIVELLVNVAQEMTKEVPVGTIKADTLAEMKMNDEIHDLAHAEYEKDIAPFKAKLAKTCEHHEERNNEIWEKVMDELEVTQGERDKPYSLNMDTGEVKMPAFAVEQEPETEPVK